MNDITADVPGGDGQYYFGTFHKPKVFNIDFAFDNLTEAGLVTLKKAFRGKELKELCFAERENVVYMAKVTGSPVLKVIPFDENNNTIYKGEGNIQLTAYWPYARDKEINIFSLKLPKGETTASSTSEKGRNPLTNSGDIPTFIELFSDTPITKIEFNDENKTTITGSQIIYWNSKTGIVKNDSGIISYEGNGAFQLPVGTTIVTVTYEEPGEVVIKYYQ
jgi:hypothetical protein